MKKSVQKEVLIAPYDSLYGNAVARGEVFRGFAAGTKVDPWVILGGTLAIDFKIGIPQHATRNPNLPYHQSEVKLQTKYTFGQMKAALERAGSSLNNAVQMTCFMIPDCLIKGSTNGTIQDYLEERDNWFKPPLPVSSYVTIKDLFPKGPLVEINMVAFTNDVKIKVVRVNPDKVPPPASGETMAIKAGPWVFLSGFGPTDWKNPVAPEAQMNPGFAFGSDVQLQAEYTLKKMKIVLEEAGSSLNNVVRASVYLTDARDMYVLDEVWKKYFPLNPPARLVLPVDGLPISSSWKVQIDMIAVTKESGIKKEVIEVDGIPKPLSHESTAVKAGSMLFISGQVAADENGLVQDARMHKDFPYAERSIKRQTSHIIKKIQKICEAAGTSIDNLLMRQAFFTNLPDDIYPSWEVWGAAFVKSPPTSSGVGITGPLTIPQCDLIIETWAFIPEKQRASRKMAEVND